MNAIAQMQDNLFYLSIVFFCLVLVILLPLPLLIAMLILVICAGLVIYAHFKTFMVLRYEDEDK